MSGGQDTGSKSGSKKGKAKMSQKEWDKLSSKQRDIDYGGSRFERVTKSDNQRGGASESGGDR